MFVRPDGRAATRPPSVGAGGHERGEPVPAGRGRENRALSHALHCEWEFFFFFFFIRLLQVTPDLSEVQKLHRKNCILEKNKISIIQ